MRSTIPYDSYWPGFIWSALARCVLGAASLLASLAAPLHAADRYWDNASGSPFPFYTDATFWSTDPALTLPAPAAPVAGDSVFFLFNTAPYSVILSAGNAATNVAASNGDVTFTGPGGTLANSGTATIDDPSTTTLTEGVLVTLDGPAWDSAGNATIGKAGAGTLTVRSGGDFEANQFLIGDGPIAKGEVTVTASGSTLNASLNSNVSLYSIGVNGGTGTLHVLAGADITTTSITQGDISIGEGAGSVGTLNIDGTGSTAESEDVNVGYGGTGFLNITNGGSMALMDAAATTRNLTVALTIQPSGAIGTGTVLVDGDNSLLSVGTFSLGDTGIGTTTVSGGGRIAVIAGANTLLGNFAGSSGMLTVTGVGSLADSTLAVTGNLLVGNVGQGILRAELGGNVTVSGSLFIGDDILNTSDNSVTITGSGSLLTVGSVLYVGNEAVGNNTPGSETTNSLGVTSGATASAVFLRVGEIAGSKGAMLVGGAGSSFSSTNDAVIGSRGTGSLEVSGGAVVSNTNAFYVGFDGAGVGNVLVTGAGSVLQANGVASSASVLIGGNLSPQAGGVGVVTVAAGGRLNTTQNVFLGGNTAGNGTLLVTGPGSLVDSDDGGANENTYVGYANRGTMTIADGASVNSELVRIGELATVIAGEAAATVTGVNGSASTWNVSGNVIVGNAGAGSLNITAGGRLISNSAAAAALTAIGNGTASDGSSLVIDGAGSNWTHTSSDFSVAVSGGDVANPVMLTIQNGGSLNVARILIADAAGSRGIATVTGAGSRLDASTDLFVGDQAVGFLNVTAGGIAQAQNAIEVGSFAAGNGTVLVDGASSRLISGGYLSLGDSSATSAAVGLLTIQNGGTVDTGTNAFVGRFTLGNGTAHVNNGGTWNVATSMYVAGDLATAAGVGGSRTLNVNAGGLVDIASTLKVWNNGIVNLNGGTIEANALDVVEVGVPQFNFNSGTFRFASTATLNTDTLEDLLGVNPTLTAGKQLAVVSTAAFSAPLRVNGGTLSFGNVTGLFNVDFDAGTLNITSANLVVGASGLFGTKLVIDSDQTINVTNLATVDSGSQFVVAGGFGSGGLTNNGDLVAIGSTISGPVVNNNAVTVVDTVDFNGLVSGPGDFFGPGTANFNGGMAPGASPAEIGFEGNVALTDTNTLFIEIGGTTPGSQYDRLVVAGDAALDGILDVSLVGFSPAIGQQFTVLTANSVVNNGLVLGGAAASSFSLLVGSSSVILQAVAAGLPGDYNQNGTVDAADYVVWRKNEGTTNMLPNDSIGGTIGPAQYDLWRAHFGQSAGAGAGGSADALAAAPEPESACLLLFAAAAGALRVRRAASRVPQLNSECDTPITDRY